MKIEGSDHKIGRTIERSLGAPRRAGGLGPERCSAGDGSQNAPAGQREHRPFSLPLLYLQQRPPSSPDRVTRAMRGRGGGSVRSGVTVCGRKLRHRNPCGGLNDPVLHMTEDAGEGCRPWSTSQKGGLVGAAGEGRGLRFSCESLSVTLTREWGTSVCCPTWPPCSLSAPPLRMLCLSLSQK